MMGWTTARAMFLVLLAVVVSFVVSNAYTLHRADEMESSVVSITDDAAPSIEHLAAARADLRRFQMMVNDYVNDAALGRRGDLAVIAEARRALSEDIRAYLVLPLYPGERERWQAVAAAIDEVGRIVTRAMVLVSEGSAGQANDLADHDLRRAVDRASVAINSSIDLNARQAHELAQAIGDNRRLTHRITLGLEALSIALAALAGWIAITFVRRQERLIRAHAEVLERRADELDQFAARVAHDIAGPLGAVTLTNQMVAQKLAGDPATQAMLFRGERAAQRVMRIVDGLLDFARAGATPEPGTRSEVQVVIEDVACELREVALEKDAVLRVEPFAPCAVAASPGVLTSLVANLTHNAIKYLRDAPVRSVAVRVLDTGAAVRIEVEDTGPGVPPELGRLIFQPYIRGPGTLEPGLGLGLATVRCLTEAHGGRVGVNSVVGKGSTFWFELPKAAPAQ